MLAVVYLATLAPGVTFWDAGEFITAAHGFGIPHPPGTPLFVALGRAWTIGWGGVLGVARAMNLLSALSTAAACGLAAWIVARELGDGTARRGAMTGALCAGLMTSVWANATETEVYAVALLHVMVLLFCAQRSTSDDADGERWLLCTAYLIALAPAVHLSALVGVPAAIALAARRSDGRWRFDRILLLSGMLVGATGVGRMSLLITGIGVLIAALSGFVGHWRSASHRIRTIRDALAAFALLALGASALLIMLVRARHDPWLNQGNPSTLAALTDVVARRQYDVAPMWPRAAPVWIQVANIVQYADWQFALTWGRGVFTTPTRVFTTIIFLMLGVSGWRAMRREPSGRRLADALAVLVVCGTLGVAAYLNLKAGASLGYGFVPAGAHEARERDYFFVLGFFGWGILAGFGASALVNRRGWAPALALAVALVPLVGNWQANDRAWGPASHAPRDVAVAMLGSAPPRAVLFLAGDNDSYPLWYEQQVNEVRRDVTLVTFPLLPAEWYVAEIARRTGLRWSPSVAVPGIQWQHEGIAAAIARSARDAGRPVVVSPALEARQRALLGSGWRMRGYLYESSGPANGLAAVRFDSVAPTSNVWVETPVRAQRARLSDDVSETMLELLQCPRIGSLPAGASTLRDSLEVRCNVR